MASSSSATVEIASCSSINSPLERPNPFDNNATLSSNRVTSRPPSSFEAPASTSSLFPMVNQKSQQHSYFRSRRVRKEDINDPREFRSTKKLNRFARQPWIIPLVGFLLGIAITGVLMFFGLRAETSLKFCPVLSEDFASGQLNPQVWTIEQQVGTGNGEFDQTTDDDDVLFIEDGVLHIKPKLQDEKLITTNNATIDLGTRCTGTGFFSCFAITNTTNGTIVPPVKSARINTKKGASIQYGKIEVTAKMPKGDWLWPAIWLLPTIDVYGPWPMSGEIDVAETRGNNHSYMSGQGGNNMLMSTLHWGPDSDHDSYLQTYDSMESLHSYYGDSFHTFGLIWTEKFLYTYVDNTLKQVLYVPFKEPFWSRGGYPATNANQTSMADPWSYTGRPSTPFDQKFYLVLNVAVGGTNGYFSDNEGRKPWANASPYAPKEFWEARDQWLPSWEKNGEMQVKSVKMWQQC